MVGGKALGEKLAKKLEDYSAAWLASVVAGMPTAEATRRTIIADILKVVGAAIREVTA